VLNDANIC